MTKEVIHTPVESKAGRRMVHAKGAVINPGPPALSAEQRAWNFQVEAKRKARKGTGGDDGRHA